MFITVKTNIVADEVSPAGVIYPREVLEGAIEEFNKRCSKKPVKGGYLDKITKQFIGEETHECKGAELDENGRLIFHLKFLDNQDARRAIGDITLCEGMNMSIRPYLPVIELPQNQPQNLNGKKTVTEIKKIVTLGLNSERKHEQRQNYHRDSEGWDLDSTNHPDE